MTESYGGRSVEQAVTNAMYGLDVHQDKPYIKINKEKAGFTFMPRPQLNLSDENLLRNTELYDLLEDDRYGAWNYVRSLLDPRWASNNPGKASKLLNNEMCFIPILSNTITKLQGWQTTVLETKETTPGLGKEQLVLPDGLYEINGNYDLEAVFKNMAGNMIDKILYIWIVYISLNTRGLVRPYMDLMANSKRDYTTRVYRIILTDDGRFVSRIGITGGSFPVNTEDGKVFDYDSDINYEDANSERTIRLKNSAARYNDIKAIRAFNWVVGVFKPEMADIEYKRHLGEDVGMIKVPFELYDIMNNRMYPHINILTFELEWYIDSIQIEIGD
jgi:hypothetical protein